MLGYACFFYIFAALILYWRADLHWGDGLLAGGLTLAIVVAAVTAPFAGRAVDRGHAAALLTGGAGIGAVSLAVLAVATTPAVYLLAWAGLGVAQAASQYEPCFALLIRRFGTDARAAITRVTLIGGFASTFAFPAGAALAEAFGWRVAVWVAVAVAAGLILPLNLIGARILARGVPPAVPGRDRPKVAFWATFRHWPFLRLTLMFSLLALGHWMLIAFLRPVLAGIGVPDGLAVMAAATIGPAQVAGRLALMAAGVRLGGRTALLLTLAGFLAAPAVLVMAGVAMPLVFGFALLQGAANGVLTILRPLLVAEDLGSESFGTLSGMMAVATLAASAVAPVLGAALMAAGGWGLLVSVAGLTVVLALGLALLPRA
jgi:predicted MFS family arabinose efflux permease